MSKQRAFRMLSHGEQAFFRGSISICTMSLIEGTLPSEIIQHSLDLLIERNPLLGCKVEETNQGVCFATASARRNIAY